MGDGTNVDPDELHSYARKLRDRSGAVTDAANATAGVDLGFAPYGTINQWFGHLVRQDAHEITATLGTLAENLKRDADTLDASADDFRHQDDATADTFTRMNTGD